jgi:hypothetical protein
VDSSPTLENSYKNDIRARHSLLSLIECCENKMPPLDIVGGGFPLQLPSLGIAVYPLIALYSGLFISLAI